MRLPRAICFGLLLLAGHALAAEAPSKSDKSTVAKVTTAKDFKLAIKAGEAHIAIADHLDLTTLDVSAQERGNAILPALFYPQESTLSIQGQCPEASPYARVDLKYNQCLLKTVKSVFMLRYPQKLWLNNLVLQAERPDESSSSIELIYLDAGMDTQEKTLWMSHVGLIGDGYPNCRGVYVGLGSKLSVYRSVFADLHFESGAAVLIWLESLASLTRCEVRGCNGTLATDGAIYMIGNGAALRLESTEFFNNAPHDVAKSGAAQGSVYNNDPSQLVFWFDSGGDTPPQPLSEAPYTFATQSDVGRAAIERSALEGKPIDLKPKEEKKSTGLRVDGRWIVGILVGAGGALVLLRIFIWWWKRQQKAHGHGTEHDVESRPRGPGSEMAMPLESLKHFGRSHSIRSDLSNMDKPSRTVRSAPCSTSSLKGGSCPVDVTSLEVAGHMIRTSASARTALTVPRVPEVPRSEGNYSHRAAAFLDAGDSARDRQSSQPLLEDSARGVGSYPAYPVQMPASMPHLPTHSVHTASEGGTGSPADSSDSGLGKDLPLTTDIVELALDEMMAVQSLYAGKYILMPERRVGRETVVHFAKVADDAENQFALKFYCSRQAYRRERELVQMPAFKRIMPRTHEMLGNEDRRLKTPSGAVLPPCIVIERGETLTSFAAKEQHEHVEIVQALILMVKRLSALHAAGWAHRDLKPDNILRMPHHSWTLNDFSHCARMGTTAGFPANLAYSPPEVMTASEAGSTTMTVSAASDMWALGVIAFELLTESRAFPKDVDEKTIADQLTGRSPLPWESGGGRVGVLIMMRQLKSSILECLDREPEKRPSAEKLADTWTTVFQSMSPGMQ